MPELPEVETVRQTLRQFILGREIIGIDVYYPKMIESDMDDFYQLTHQHFIEVDRLGKYLIFILDHNAFISHLRMEGKYHIVDSDEPITKHTHVCFHLDNGEDLRYLDTRKFGRMRLVDKQHYLEQLPLSKLGKEPFDITTDELYDLLHHSSLTIKGALLNQGIMCGIGNIYANEICFAMRIDPRSKASRLSKKRCDELRNVSIDILNRAIKQGGTTISTFDANGIHGLFQIELKVHGKETCPECGSPIKKIYINQRGTYFCPICQKRRY
ncbi:MAG: DNA-formamidopyrimidine glycosylase [Erysipelotrichaceae bacterium]|nr:DNA-formamidopyrimidine glycosylase [Erysipelotrichaceae bacterium]